MIAVFDSVETMSFLKIEYRLAAADLPKPVTGEIHVITEKSGI
jgi:hypothetical protein